jgi:hypothetical protein
MIKTIVVVVVTTRMKMIIMIIVICDNQIYGVYEQHTHTPYFPKYKHRPPPLPYNYQFSGKYTNRVIFDVLLTVHLDTSV